MKRWMFPLLALATFACSKKDQAPTAPKAKVESAAVATSTVVTTSTAGAVKYTFDGSTSKLQFVGAKVTGKHDGGFKTFTGAIYVPSGKPESALVDLTIDMSSVWSDSEKLTGHLKSADFFDAEKIPTTRFRSTGITPANGAPHTITGDLTLHGVTKRISFPATVNVSDQSATAKATFSINRKDFNINYPGMPNDLIKEDVVLTFDINAKREQ